jgi:hypothetical protein
MIKFFDSASGAIEPGRRAALYIDGSFRASEIEKLAHPHHRWITVLGDPQASCADYEPGNALYEPGVLRAWATARRALGEHDVVRVYCDRADAAKAAAEVAGIPHLWWISTLDGKRWTASELASDLTADFGVDINPAHIWANQYQGGPHAAEDVSDLFGEW